MVIFHIQTCVQKFEGCIFYSLCQGWDCSQVSVHCWRFRHQISFKTFSTEVFFTYVYMYRLCIWVKKWFCTIIHIQSSLWNTYSNADLAHNTQDVIWVFSLFRTLNIYQKHIVLAFFIRHFKPKKSFWSIIRMNYTDSFFWTNRKSFIFSIRLFFSLKFMCLVLYQIFQITAVWLSTYLMSSCRCVSSHLILSCTRLVWFCTKNVCFVIILSLLAFSKINILYSVLFLKQCICNNLFLSWIGIFFWYLSVYIGYKKFVKTPLKRTYNVVNLETCWFSLSDLSL